MNQKQMVANTLVCLKRMQAGVLQEQLLRELHELGFTAVEVRRECFHDFAAELPAVAATARELGTELYYSVPSYLYEGGTLMKERLEEFYIEAQTMGCRNVKLNIGDYGAVTRGDAETINALCRKYRITQTVENDQTPENGRCEKIKAFLDEAHALGAKIGFTFDMGNWLWTGETPKMSAHTLYPYISYIHAKNVLEGQPAAAPRLDAGCLDWRELLRELPPNLPVALEYPCDVLPAEMAALQAADY